MDASSSANPFADLVNEVFDRFNDSGIGYLVLRNYETLPESTSNDIDLLLSPAHRGRALSAIQKASAATGWRICGIAEFACTSVFLYHEKSMAQTHIDLMCGVKWHPLLIADHETMLETREKFKSFYIPAQRHEAHVSLLTRLVYGGYVKEKYRPFIAAVARKDPDGLRDSLRPWLGRHLAGSMVAMAAEENWSGIEASAKNTRMRILLANLKHPFPLALRFIRDAARTVGRMVFPPGLSVCLRGCGAETMLPDVLRELSGTFHGEKVLRLPASFKKRRRILFRCGMVIAVNGRAHATIDVPDGASAKEVAHDILSAWEKMHHPLRGIPNVG